MAAVVIALSLGLAACGDEQRAADNRLTRPEREVTTASGGPLVLNLALVAELDQPIAAASHPDAPDHLWVAERPGRIRVLDLTSGEVSEPVLDVSDQTDTESERGLLGLAISADGTRLFTNTTGPDGQTVITRYPVDLGVRTLAADAGEVLLEVEQPAPNHNGGHLAIAPDGYLWIGLGDGGGADDQFGNAQNPATLLGSMLRIDGSAPLDALVPSSNPCSPTPTECRPEIVAIGLRNPWRYSFDPATGDLWIGDVGQGAWEEIDVVRTGQVGPLLNFGWPRFEGSHSYLGDLDDGILAGVVVSPIHEYSHDDGCSVTGGVVYRGRAIPALDGIYLYGDYCTSVVWGLDTTSGVGVEPVDIDLEVPGGQLASFATDSAGEVYVLSLTGGLYRLEEA